MAPISLSVPDTSFHQAPCRLLGLSLSLNKYFSFHTHSPLAVLHFAYSLFGSGVKKQKESIALLPLCGSTPHYILPLALI